MHRNWLSAQQDYRRKSDRKLAHHIGDFDHPMHFCIFKVGKNPDKAKKHKQADRKCIQNDRQYHTVSDRQRNKGRIDHQITDRPDQHGDRVEFSGLIPQKADDSRRK